MSGAIGVAAEALKYNPRSILLGMGDDADEWTCPQCTFVNTGNACEMCGAPKPKGNKLIETKNNSALFYKETIIPKYQGKTYRRKNYESFNAKAAGIKNYYPKFIKILNLIEC